MSGIRSQTHTKALKLEEVSVNTAGFPLIDGTKIYKFSESFASLLRSSSRS